MPYRSEFADFFADISFLQVPPLDGYPRLTLPTAKHVVVFHHLINVY